MSKKDATLTTNAVSTASIDWSNHGIGRTWIGDPLPGTNINDYYTYPKIPNDWNTTTVSPHSTTTISTAELERLMREMGPAKNALTESGRARITKQRNAGRALAERLNDI